MGEGREWWSLPALCRFAKKEKAIHVLHSRECNEWPMVDG